MARSSFIENHIPGKMIFAGQVTYAPANSVVLVANKNGFVATRTSFRPEFRRYSGKALAPPYAEMGEVRFDTVHDFIGGSVGRKS